jgi:hypothetical protein
MSEVEFTEIIFAVVITDLCGNHPLQVLDTE